MEKDFSGASYRQVRSDLLEWSYAAGKGKPCGASHISQTYTCKLDAAGMGWDEKAGQVGPKTRSEVAKLQETLERVKPQKLQDMWRAEVDTMMSEAPKMYHSHGKGGGEPEAYSESAIDTGMAGRAKGINKLIENGYPENVKFRDGSVEAAPPGMTPFITSKGQGGWVHPTNGLKYNTQEDGTATQNRAGLFDSARRAQDITDFRESQMRGGKPWPTQELPSQGEKMDGKKIYDNLSRDERNAIVLNGIPRTGTGPAAQMVQYYKDNPKEADARVREICDRYAAQDGRSGVSGKPISLPGVKAKPGQEQATVDHFDPAAEGKGKTAAQFRKTQDNGKNFLLTEEGPNSQRSNRPWDDWADNKLPALTAMKGPSKEQLAKIPDWSGSPKLSVDKPKRSDKSPGAQQRREAIARSDKRVKEIQKESSAAQKSRYKELQQAARQRGDDSASDYWKTAIGNLD